MTVYFVTRFSICDSKFRGFRLSQDHTQKEYERRLFSKARLDYKFETLQNITLPSIVGQSCDNWRWLIYTSDRLPDQYMRRLGNLVRDYASIVLITVRDFGDFFEKARSYDYGKSFATVRIDDDDGVSRLLAEKLQQYSGYVGSIISFTEGTLVKWSEGRMLVGERISAKNNALGLAGIGLDIYSCGRHSDIDTRYKVIYDSSPDMYLLGCSSFTDTQRGFTKLGGVLNKVRRLFFLSFHRPAQARTEFAETVRKRLRHWSR